MDRKTEEARLGDLGQFAGMCSEDDGVPDMGFSVGLGGDWQLVVGEMPGVESGWGVKIYGPEKSYLLGTAVQSNDHPDPIHDGMLALANHLSAMPGAVEPSEEAVEAAWAELLLSGPLEDQKAEICAALRAANAIDRPAPVVDREKVWREVIGACSDWWQSRNATERAETVDKVTDAICALATTRDEVERETDLDLAKRERWAMVSPEGTPKHLATVKLYDTREEAEEYASRPEWSGQRVLPASDVSALLRYQRSHKGSET